MHLYGEENKEAETGDENDIRVGANWTPKKKGMGDYFWREGKSDFLVTGMEGNNIAGEQGTVIRA